MKLEKEKKISRTSSAKKFISGIEETLEAQIEDEVEALRSSKRLSLKDAILQLAIVGSQNTVPTEEPTFAPTAEPTYSPTEVPTAIPTVSHAPTFEPTYQQAKTANSLVTFQIETAAKTCSEFLSDSTVLVTTKATVTAANADNGVFWKCIDSDGKTQFCDANQCVYDTGAGLPTSRRRLDKQQKRRQPATRHHGSATHHALATDTFTLFVNVTKVFPPSTPDSVVKEEAQALSADIVAAFDNNEFTAILQDVAKEENVPELITSSSDAAVTQNFVSELLINPPTYAPTAAPTAPSAQPTYRSTKTPIARPTKAPVSSKPSSIAPSAIPTLAPSGPSVAPTFAPTAVPSSIAPSAAPSSIAPTESPSDVPSAAPSEAPSAGPTETPTFKPTRKPQPLPTPSPTTVPSPGTAKLSVTILTAQFAIRKNVPIRSNATTCHITGYQDVPALELILKVENEGTADYIVSPSEISAEKCNQQVKSYPSFYSIQVNSPVVTVKTRSEKCIADTASLPRYTCASDTTQGISAKDHLISSQYVDMSNSGLVDGQSYTVQVTVLPKNVLYTAVSNVFTLKYTAPASSRKRNLRELKAKPSSSSPSDAFLLALGDSTVL